MSTSLHKTLAIRQEERGRRNFGEAKREGAHEVRRGDRLWGMLMFLEAGWLLAAWVGLSARGGEGRGGGEGGFRGARFLTEKEGGFFLFFFHP